MDDKIKAGLYIGHGSKPDNVDADMYVNMEGKNVGVYIGGGHDEKDILDMLNKSIQENPQLADVLTKYLKELSNSQNDAQKKTTIFNLRDFLSKNYANLIGTANLLWQILKDVK